MWILTNDDDQMYLWCQVFEGEDESIINRRRSDDVVIVKNDDNSIGDCSDFIDQRGQYIFIQSMILIPPYGYAVGG